MLKIDLIRLLDRKLAGNDNALAPAAAANANSDTGSPDAPTSPAVPQPARPVQPGGARRAPPPRTPIGAPRALRPRRRS